MYSCLISAEKEPSIIIKQDMPEKSIIKTEAKVKVVDYKIKDELKNVLPHIEEKIEIDIRETEVPQKNDNLAEKDKPSTSNNANVIVNTKSEDKIPPFVKIPDISKEGIINISENEEQYDSGTLKPQQNKDWACKMCTLLNPITSNICAVCASIRQQEDVNQFSKGAKKKTTPVSSTKTSSGHHYLQLVNLDNNDLVENTMTFECPICLSDIEPNRGVTLRECLHQFCKVCLANTIEFTDEAEIKCPYRDAQYFCDIALQDREIKALVTPALYDQYLARSVTEAENKTEKSFHCKTPDCKGWCIFEDNVNEFRCPVCLKANCMTCQVSYTFDIISNDFIQQFQTIFL